VKNGQALRSFQSVLDKRTDTRGRVQFLVRWRGYGKKYDTWVDEADTNERPLSETTFPHASTRIARPATDLISSDRGKAEHEEASQNEYCKACLRHHANGRRNL